MFFKLLGFTQNGPVRRFTFHRIESGAAPAVCVVLADTALARRYHIGLQELPALCSSALAAAGPEAFAAPFILSEESMQECATANSAVAAQLAAARDFRSRRAAAKAEQGVPCAG